MKIKTIIILNDEELQHILSAKPTYCFGDFALNGIAVSEEEELILSKAVFDAVFSNETFLGLPENQSFQNKKIISYRFKPLSVSFQFRGDTAVSWECVLQATNAPIFQINP